MLRKGKEQPEMRKTVGLSHGSCEGMALNV